MLGLLRKQKGSEQMSGSSMVSYRQVNAGLWEVLGLQNKGWPEKVKNPLGSGFLHRRDMPPVLSDNPEEASWYQDDSNETAIIINRLGKYTQLAFTIQPMTEGD
jgi:hypothetical protein